MNDFRIYDDIYKVHRIIIEPIMTEKAILKEKNFKVAFSFMGKRYDNSYVFRHLVELMNYKVVQMKNLKAFSDEAN